MFSNKLDLYREYRVAYLDLIDSSGYFPPSEKFLEPLPKDGIRVFKSHLEDEGDLGIISKLKEKAVLGQLKNEVRLFSIFKNSL